MTTPKLSLSRMEEYCKAATPGPWILEEDEECVHGIATTNKQGWYSWDICTTDAGFYGPKKNDADFIANARTDLPTLLSWAKRARKFLSDIDNWTFDGNSTETLRGLLEECGE